MLGLSGRMLARSVAGCSSKGVAPLASRWMHSSAVVRSNPPTADDVVSQPDFGAYRASTLVGAGGDASRRAFSYFVLGGFGVTVASAAKQSVVGVLNSLNPSADVLAMANIEFDLDSVEEGKTATIKWRGKPVFVRHRTDEEIELARADDSNPDLRDKQVDADRAYLDPKYLIVLGICTHLGCVPLSGKGDYKGWFCPCHGSHYDLSGRIRKGPAPLNLETPPYMRVEDTDNVILIGERA